MLDRLVINYELKVQNMSSMETLQKELSALKDERDAISSKIRDKLIALAEHCHAGLGSTVAVTGYSHSGKKIIVDSIRYLEVKGWGGKPDTYFECTGHVLKKDGKTGIHRGEHHC